MDIPNLSTQAIPTPPVKKRFSPPPLLIITLFALIFGYALSRFYPINSNNSATMDADYRNQPQLSTDAISHPDQLKIGQLYGNLNQAFKDTASGIVKKGDINGVGTHILLREGGDSQRVSLISSTVDLELFIDKKVEIKGETNASDKTGWLVDVGSIKIIE